MTEVNPADLKPGMRVQFWSGGHRYGAAEGTFLEARGSAYTFRLGMAEITLYEREDGELYDGQGQRVTCWQARPQRWRGAIG
jgi:hypothetical protein